MKPRLWPAILVLGAGLAWIARAWSREGVIRQERIVQTLVASLLVLVGLTVWLAFFSRLPGRLRRRATAAVLLSIGVLAAAFRVRGVTGDFVPIVEPRWARAPDVHPSVPATAVNDLPRPESTTPIGAERGPIGAASDRSAGETAAAGRPGSGRTPAAAGTPLEPVPVFPQFLGPTRDAVLPEPRLARDFASRPPRALWRRAVGAAWSGFAVAGPIAVTQEQHGKEERVVAYDTETGRPLWSHAEAARYETLIAGIGPRATPTLHAGRVFAMGATGILTAVDLASGRRLWSRDVVGQNGGSVPDWGTSCSPLVVDGRVVVSAGGPGGRSLVAYDEATGSPLWTAGSDGSGYSSPVVMTLGGRRQIVILNRSSVAGHDVETGTVLWQHPFPDQQPNVTVPLPLPGDRLLVSVGYGIGSKAYRLSASNGDRGLEATLLWESPRLKSKFGNLVWHEGSVYGLDDGVLTCLDPERGERRWKAGRYGHGQLLLVAGLLLVQTEEGEIVLVEASPHRHKELTRFSAVEGKTWNPPALAGRRLLVRNDREAAAYELPVE